jgi:glucose 1-dehydrogenase
MKAIAVLPGVPGSVHLADVPEPRLDDVPDGRGVLVRVLRVGVDATDREINAAEYGAAPDGADYLVLGHEAIGEVVSTGAGVSTLRPGDLVVPSVRRPGGSLYDTIGAEDMTTDAEYLERGISHLHGFLAERFVEDERYLVRLPEALREVGVLLEPFTVVEKAVAQAFEVQRRLRVWQPRRAAVIGAGTIGLLATMLLRLRGLDVTTFATARPPSRNAALVERVGARYVSVRDAGIGTTAASHGAFDLIIEASGHSPSMFEAMTALARNGVVVLLSVTGGSRTAEVPADRINLEFVLGNRALVGSVNANREHFEAGVRDLVFARATWPGLLEAFLTDRIVGLDRWQELFARLERGSGAIKVLCDVQ